MSAPPPPDHDQRLKVLLKEFFVQFFLCFFPAWAERFDFTAIDWLDKEVFLAPPQGEKRQLDLVARLRLRPGAPPPCEGVTDLVALVHVEVETRQSAVALRPRMFEYYVQLRRNLGLPVLPIGLFLRVGLEGVGWDTFEEFFWEHCILRFEYAYVGLPGLDAEQYATGEHLLGVALSQLMRVTPERRAELFAEGLQRIARSGENDWRRHLLQECLEAYADLDEAQKGAARALLTTEPYQEVKTSMITTYERGMAEGIVRGQRVTALLQLEARFGPLSPAVRQRVEALSPDELRQLTLDFVKAQSLKDPFGGVNWPSPTARSAGSARNKAFDSRGAIRHASTSRSLCRACESDRGRVASLPDTDHIDRLAAALGAAQLGGPRAGKLRPPRAYHPAAGRVARSAPETIPWRAS